MADELTPDQLRTLLGKANDRLEVLHPENFTVLAVPAPVRAGSGDGWWVHVQVYIPDKAPKPRRKRRR